MIEKIERLCTQLQINPLRQRRVLNQRSIKRVEAWPIDDVTSGVSKRARGGERESVRIEPALRSSGTRVRVAHQVRPIVGAETQRGDSRTAVVKLSNQRHSKRPAALNCHDARSLPAA